MVDAIVKFSQIAGIGILVAFVAAMGLSALLVPIVRSERSLTWTQAILVGVLICSISLLLLGEIPSRFLYLFAAKHAQLGAHIRWLPILKGDNYTYIADIIANTVQGVFFILIMALAYFWGERQRKLGRFKS